jgi:hypothetical protein
MVAADEKPADAQYTVKRIWDEAPHSAFTDLIRFRGRFYCTFREGAGHVPRGPGSDGRIRVIASDDADAWKSVALLQEEGVDLRDPKLSITPDGRLMVLMGGSYYRDGVLLRQLPRVAFADGGEAAFSPTRPVVIDAKIATDRDWLWRVTWHGHTAYGVVYQSSGDRSHVHLVKSTDGVHYAHVAELQVDGNPNEATIRFLPYGEMLIVVRREGGSQRGFLGRSRSPFTDWTWQEMSHRLGGPDFVALPDGKLIVGTRKYVDDGETTIIGSVAVNGVLTELVELPSGGDTSYPGMLVHDGELFVSYYSSHEEKTAVYLARIPLAELHRGD